MHSKKLIIYNYSDTVLSANGSDCLEQYSVTTQPITNKQNADNADDYDERR